MLKSIVDSITLIDSSSEILENLLQIAVFNNGDNPITVLNQVIEPDSAPFIIDPTNTYFDFKLDNIRVSREGGNNVLIRYQKVILPTKTVTKNC